MKALQKLTSFFILLLLITPQTAYSQETSLCEILGKKSNVVVSKFGKPQHHDKSNPSMECLFYQKKQSRLAFIADKNGVYQIQADYFYNSSKEANKALDVFISECYSKELKIDTVSAGNYKIFGSGVKMEMSLFHNNYSNNYEVKIKAERSEIK